MKKNNIEKGVCRISLSLPIPIPLPVFPESRAPSIDVLQRHKRLKVNLRDFNAKARDVISILRHDGYFNGNAVEVSVVFGDDPFLRSLKKKYFGLNHATDVVAFPQQRRQQAEGNRQMTEAQRHKVTKPIPLPLPAFPESRTLLGDVAISLDRAKQQGKEHGHSFPDEVLYLFIHGMLHLLGFCDSPEPAAKQMLEKQNKIWDNVRRSYKRIK